MFTESHTEDKALAQSPLQIQKIVLSGESTLQVKILSNLICDSFDLDCHLCSFHDLKDRLKKYEDSVIAIDCMAISSDLIRDLLEYCHGKQYQARIALVNVKSGSSHEALAEWPQVVGIFPDYVEPELLLDGFEAILNDQLWLPRNVMENLLKGTPRKAPKQAKPPVKLTRRESQILEKLSEGTSNTNIAASLFLSEHTVKSHLYNIYKKVNVRNRTQACNWLKQYQHEFS